MRDIEDYEDNYKRNNFEDYKVKYRRQEILKNIEKYNPKSILEIGIGWDPLFQYVNGIDFTIVEPSGEFIKNAEKLKDGKNVKLIKGFFEDVVEKNNIEGSFDMIICASLLHEVENPERLLNAIFKESNSNTVIVIIVPNANSLHRLIGVEAGIIKDTHNLSENNMLFQQHNVFDIERLCEMIKKSGFEICDYGTFFLKPFSHTQMWQCMNYGIINDGIIEALYKVGERHLSDYGSELYVICKKDMR